MKAKQVQMRERRSQKESKITKINRFTVNRVYHPKTAFFYFVYTESVTACFLALKREKAQRKKRFRCAFLTASYSARYPAATAQRLHTPYSMAPSSKVNPGAWGGYWVPSRYSDPTRKYTPGTAAEKFAKSSPAIWG